MKRNLRILKGAVAILVACAACCALPILVGSGISGAVVGELAALADIDGWMVGLAVAVVVALAGALRLHRARERRRPGL